MMRSKFPFSHIFLDTFLSFPLPQLLGRPKGRHCRTCATPCHTDTVQVSISKPCKFCTLHSLLSVQNVHSLSHPRSHTNLSSLISSSPAILIICIHAKIIVWSFHAYTPERSCFCTAEFAQNGILACFAFSLWDSKNIIAEDVSLTII